MFSKFPKIYGRTAQKNILMSEYKYTHSGPISVKMQEHIEWITECRNNAYLGPRKDNERDLLIGHYWVHGRWSDFYVECDGNFLLYNSSKLFQKMIDNSTGIECILVHSTPQVTPILPKIKKEDFLKVLDILGVVDISDFSAIEGHFSAESDPGAIEAIAALIGHYKKNTGNINLYQSDDFAKKVVEMLFKPIFRELLLSLPPRRRNIFINRVPIELVIDMQVSWQYRGFGYNIIYDHASPTCVINFSHHFRDCTNGIQYTTMSGNIVTLRDKK